MSETTINVKDLGLLLVSSVRYALGRRTYIVSTTVDVVTDHLAKVSGHDRSIMIRDIEEARDRGALGDDFDAADWLALLAVLRSAQEKSRCDEIIERERR